LPSPAVNDKRSAMTTRSGTWRDYTRLIFNLTTVHIKLHQRFLAT
jgi:hypothetical protein